MASRQQRALIAQETLEILDRGWYISPKGLQISIADPLNTARQSSVHYRPEDFGLVFKQRDNEIQKAGGPTQTDFQVLNSTTLFAAKHCVTISETRNVLCLNFASAKHPGGGFLGGSQAQEESLARATGLYSCIVQMKEMYNANQRYSSCLYTDHMIYSPKVPVFRDDNDALLEKPYFVSIITAPAVNAGAVRAQEKHNLAQIEPVMISRIDKILSIAAVHHYDTLILGAWGCGVFKNDPADVAKWFDKLLAIDGVYKRIFRLVVFAVLDTSAEKATFNAFASTFTG